MTRGRRQGYANRTDLQGAPKVPLSAAPGQEYGQQAAQIAAQRAVPIAQPPNAAQIQPAPASPPAPAGPTPGQITGLADPTERPSEPVQAGLPIGPGPGPEVFNGGINPLVRGLAILNLLGDSADAPTQNLRAQLQATLGNQNAP